MDRMNSREGGNPFSFIQFLELGISIYISIIGGSQGSYATFILIGVIFELKYYIILCTSAKQGLGLF